MKEAESLRFCLVELGYVGIPLAVEFGGKQQTIGSYIHAARVSELQTNLESTLEVSASVALGKRTSLIELFQLTSVQKRLNYPDLSINDPVHREYRRGDVLRSLVDKSEVQRSLGYAQKYRIKAGLERSMARDTDDLMGFTVTEHSSNLFR